MALHMYETNAFMAEVSRVSSDAKSEKVQLAELKDLSERLPERAPPPNGGRWWALEVRHENFKYAMEDESIKKWNRGDDLYRHLEETKVPMIKHKRKPDTGRPRYPY